MEEFKNWEEEDFIEHILELRERVEELQEKIKSQPVFPEKIAGTTEAKHLEKSYKQEWSYPGKIAYLLSLYNKPLTSIEIHELLMKWDKNYPTYSNPKATLSVYLNAATKRGRIKAIKVPGLRELNFCK